MRLNHVRHSGVAAGHTTAVIPRPLIIFYFFFPLIIL